MGKGTKILCSYHWIVDYPVGISCIVPICIGAQPGSAESQGFDRSVREWEGELKWRLAR